MMKVRIVQIFLDDNDLVSHGKVVWPKNQDLDRAHAYGVYSTSIVDVYVIDGNYRIVDRSNLFSNLDGKLVPIADGYPGLARVINDATPLDEIVSAHDVYDVSIILHQNGQPAVLTDSPGG